MLKPILPRVASAPDGHAASLPLSLSETTPPSATFFAEEMDGMNPTARVATVTVVVLVGLPGESFGQQPAKKSGAKGQVQVLDL